MEGTKQGVSDTPQEPVGDNQGEQKQEDVVRYSSFKRVLDEKKRMQREKEDAFNRIKEMEQKELESQGKKDELIESLRQELNQTRTKYKEMETTNAWNKLTGQIKDFVKKEGCSYPEQFIKLMDKKDFDLLSLSDGNVNEEDLRSLAEKSRKVNPFLFQSKAKVNDVIPNGAIKQDKGKSLQDMSEKELIEFAKSLEK